MFRRIKLGKKQLGQLCLVGAVILNFIALMLNLRVSHLEAELTDLKDDERYFMFNKQSASAEEDYRIDLHTSLNMLRVLRRLAVDRLTPTESELLLKDQRALQHEIDCSLRRVAALTYIMGNDPAPGEDLDDKFAPMTDKQLQDLMPDLQEQAWKYANTFKTQMVETRHDISFWKMIYSTVLIFSMIIIIIGNIFIFSRVAQECLTPAN